MANLLLLLQILSTGLTYYFAFVLRMNYTHFLIFTFIGSLITSVLLLKNKDFEKEMNNIGLWILSIITIIMIWYRYGFLKLLGTFVLQFITGVFAALLFK